MKIFRKFFLTSTLFALSCASFLGAMEQKLDQDALQKLNPKEDVKMLLHLWNENNHINIDCSATDFAKNLILLKPIWNKIEILAISNCSTSKFTNIFIPETFRSENFSSLRTLYLYSSNLDSDLLNQISTFTKLKFLYFNDCALSEIPDSFNKNNLHHLKIIKFKESKISTELKHKIIAAFSGSKAQITFD